MLVVSCDIAVSGCVRRAGVTSGVSVDRCGTSRRPNGEVGRRTRFRCSGSWSRSCRLRSVTLRRTAPEGGGREPRVAFEELVESREISEAYGMRDVRDGALTPREEDLAALKPSHEQVAAECHTRGLPEGTRQV